MGFLKKILKRFGASAGVQQLPAGSMTVDRQGRVVTTTVSSTYPAPLLDEIGQGVQTLFMEARAAQMTLSELSLNFGSLRITARELRGGAIVFLHPQTARSNMQH
jgi:hypothetical protein